MPDASVWQWDEAALRELMTATVVGLVQIAAALAVVLLGLAIVSRIAR